jgi:hypothetical protein
MARRIGLAILGPAVFMIGLNCWHGLWHLDDMTSGWGHRTYMAWSDPVFLNAALWPHTLIVIVGEFVLPGWVLFWLWRGTKIMV